MEIKVRMSNLLVLFLLMLFFSLSHARRLTPRFSSSTVEAELPGGDEEVVEEISCEGVSEEDCLERRTLLAHTDYIYTQKENP